MTFGKWILTMGTFATAIVICLILPIAAKNNTSVSPALGVIAEENGMAMAARVGEDIGFSAEVFERAMNVSSITSLTVTELPERTDGILYLGNSEVSVGQVISRANVSFLKFVFCNKEIQNSSFRFSTDRGQYDIECGLYSLKYENRCPSVVSNNKEALEVGTYRDIMVYGQMDAYDPDGDSMTYEIVTYPKNGLLVREEKNTGRYQYIPDRGYTGKDSFRYVAVDCFGNYSDVAEVNVEVTQQSNGLRFIDLEGRASHVAAVTLTEHGIMASAELNGAYYFYPSQEVSRAEFLTMAMKTLGIEIKKNAVSSVFADDAEIPDEYKIYVDAAQKLGYVAGKIDGNGELIFAPNDSITRAEAAVILQNMVGLEVPVIKPMLVDTGTVPAWAKDAVYAMNSCGIMVHEGGYISADSAVTREQSAEMLYRLSNIIQSQ